MVKTIWIGDVQAGKYDDQEVELKGWIKRERGSNKMRFIVLRDSTGHIQCVVKKDAIGEELFQEVKNVLIETSVVISGVVNADERADGGHELIATSFEIIGAVNAERPFPINKEALESAVDEDGELMPGGSEFLLDHRHLYLRTSRMTSMLKLRSSAWCDSQLF